MPDPPLGGLSKHSDHLQLLAMMMGDRVPERVADAQTMEDAYKTLLGYPSIGPFLAYQYVVDLNYSDLTHFSEMDGERGPFSVLTNGAPSKVAILLRPNQP